MSSLAVEAGEVEKHFDALAASYDAIKAKNSYYYECVIACARRAIPSGKRVLDVGTGTGGVLHALSPSEGTGIDLSAGMIAIARKKFPSLRFFSGSYETVDAGGPFDYLLIADVIEHLADPSKLFPGIRRFCGPDTRVVLTMANPGWEPILRLLEKMKLKMEEGPHYRISEKQLLDYAASAGFALESAESSVLLPARIPLLAPLFNGPLVRLPGLRRCALILRYTFALR